MTELKTPVFSKDRIIELDVIRGIALIGIFLVNISFFMRQANVYDKLPSDNLIDILVANKFYAIFSLLFGAGTAIFLKRVEEKKQSYFIYVRRMIVLAFIGILHASIWSGDVLVIYAITGLVLLALHKLPSKLVLGISLSLHLTGIFVGVISYDYLFSDNSIGEDIFLEIMILMTSLTSFLIYFIEGFSLMKLNTLIKIKNNSTTRKKLLIYIGGISIIGITIQFLTIGTKLNFILQTVLQPFLVVAYILIIIALLQNKIGSIVLKPLQAYGKMAMSNYLAQTVIGIFILPQVVNMFQPTLAIACICILTVVNQIFCSNIWLKYFHFGPVEWIWRCLTYWKVTPMRKLS